MQTRFGNGPRRAVALVITLLMLSVITFLAIAFLAMTTRDKNAVTATIDMDTAKSMSEAALARAQAEIMAQMMSTNDILSYDYRASHNYTSGSAFVSGSALYNNVNYDSFITNAGAYSSSDYALNLYNLYYDPRPPVFVITNPNSPPDFRFWVDLNRNGRFETNGFLHPIDQSGNPDLTTVNWYNGEPEWIGVLKYPQYNHSYTNNFIGRYAYLVLPIGKTLDWNFIHNNSKNPGSGHLNLPNKDQYSRNQGVGSWELNLAALLANTNINTNIYPTNGAYNYIPNGSWNLGNAFYDASQFLSNRYAGYPSGAPIYPANLISSLSLPLNTLNYIDEYGEYPLSPAQQPIDYSQYSGTYSQHSVLPWPGSYNTNMFYDVQDLFNPTKSGPYFGSNLVYWASQPRQDSYDRYTLQRLLACIGTDSAPEYGVFVYPEGMTNGILGTAPTSFRTKVNVNYDNSAQIQAGPYSPMPTNLTAWAPLAFFTNAADLLLASQEYPVTNGVGLYFNHFGLSSGIPIYNSTNASYVYNAKIHRMLQLAANIYESSSDSTNFILMSGWSLHLPHTYRPLFAISNLSGCFTVSIIGYTNVIPRDPALNYPFFDKTDTNSLLTYANKTVPPNINIWGVPWVIGVAKNLPGFNKYTYGNRIIAQRDMIFVRGSSGGKAITNAPPQFTNQFYHFTVSNQFGIDAWCPYTNGYPRPVTFFETNLITIMLTNNFNRCYTNSFAFGTNNTFTSWPRWTGNQNSPSGFIGLLQTNITAITNIYFSDITKTFGSYSALLSISNSYPAAALPPDFMQQTFPVHNWSLYITNHVYYYAYDQITGQLLDMVNLGPFVSSNAVIYPPSQNGALALNPWLTNGATDLGGFSQGLSNQIIAGYSLTPSLYGSLNPGNAQGKPHYTDTVYMFGAGDNPSNMYDQTLTWVANDPLVHYTIDDLTWPANASRLPTLITSATSLRQAVTNDVGQIKRYDPWPGAQGATWTGPAEMLYKDPGVTKPDDWAFPTNSLPSVGWLGRIHRGTPWQTVYLKSDYASQPIGDWGGPNGWVNTFDTYPTNDWRLIDLFTAVPNDNAARGLLSVNQTNSAAWAAVFAGVIAESWTNPTQGTVISPYDDIYNLVDLTNGVFGINATRSTNVNGLFHHIGDILQSSTLSVSSPFVTNAPSPTDEMVERIPQQTLGLLKLGFPRFVIYAWGQSLKPKSLYQSAPPGYTYLANICTNYEITGEFLTRTVCHLDPAASGPTAATPKIVVDSFNIMPGN